MKRPIFISGGALPAYSRGLASFRRIFRSSEAALVLVAISTAAAAERSISTSRQFVVYGADVRLRGAVCDLAEQTKRNLLSLLGQRDEWRIPFVINAELPQANAGKTA